MYCLSRSLGNNIGKQIAYFPQFSLTDHNLKWRFVYVLNPIVYIDIYKPSHNTLILLYTGCSFCRLIRRPQHFIGRHFYLPTNWRSFIWWSSDQCVSQCYTTECDRSFYCVLCLYDSRESMSNQPARLTPVIINALPVSTHSVHCGRIRRGFGRSRVTGKLLFNHVKFFF
jgi:hypothetical protein